MGIQRYKDVSINGQDYRIGLVPAVIADRIIQVGVRNATDRVIYREVQDYILNEISVYQSGAPVKIYTDGKWLVPHLDLEYDSDTVGQLFNAGLDFNIGPFLRRQKAKAEALAAAQPQTTSP